MVKHGTKPMTGLYGFGNDNRAPQWTNKQAWIVLNHNYLALIMFNFRDMFGLRAKNPNESGLYLEI